VRFLFLNISIYGFLCIVCKLLNYMHHTANMLLNYLKVSLHGQVIQTRVTNHTISIQCPVHLIATMRHSCIPAQVESPQLFYYAVCLQCVQFCLLLNKLLYNALNIMFSWEFSFLATLSFVWMPGCIRCMDIILIEGHNKEPDLEIVSLMLYIS